MKTQYELSSPSLCLSHSRTLSLLLIISGANVKSIKVSVGLKL